MLVCSKPTKESVPGVLAGFSLAKNPLCPQAARLGEHSVGCQGWGWCWGRVTGSCAVSCPPTTSGFAGTGFPSSENPEGVKAAVGGAQIPHRDATLMELLRGWGRGTGRVPSAAGLCRTMLTNSPDAAAPAQASNFRAAGGEGTGRGLRLEWRRRNRREGLKKPNH